MHWMHSFKRTKHLCALITRHKMVNDISGNFENVFVVHEILHKVLLEIFEVVACHFASMDDIVHASGDFRLNDVQFRISSEKLCLFDEAEAKIILYGDFLDKITRMSQKSQKTGSYLRLNSDNVQ